MSDPFSSDNPTPNPNQPQGTPPPVPGAQPNWGVPAGGGVAQSTRIESARPGYRLGARLITGVLWYIIMFVPSFFFGFIATFNTSVQSMPDSQIGQLNPASTIASVVGIGAGIVMTLIALVLYFFFDIVMVSKWGGQPGKLVFSLQIVDADSGELISMKRAFKRLLLMDGITMIGYFLSFFLAASTYPLAIQCAGLIWLSVLFISLAREVVSFRGLHDKWCNTKVIRKSTVFI